MKELIKVTEQNGNNAVSARELYDFLEIRTPFKKWIDRMLEYGFEEKLDFQTFLSKSTGGRPSTDYALTLDCAKEISMLQRSDKGKQARRYFIECEKQLKEQSKPLSSLEVMAMSVQRLIEQEKQLKEHDNRLNMLEAKTTTRPDYWTIAGYATHLGVSVNLTLAAKLGRKASKICKDNDLLMDSTKDPRFGRVKMYPESILSQVFKQTQLM